MSVQGNEQSNVPQQQQVPQQMIFPNPVRYYQQEYQSQRMTDFSKKVFKYRSTFHLNRNNAIIDANTNLLPYQYFRYYSDYWCSSTSKYNDFICWLLRWTDNTSSSSNILSRSLFRCGSTYVWSISAASIGRTR